MNEPAQRMVLEPGENYVQAPPMSHGCLLKFKSKSERAETFVRGDEIAIVKEVGTVMLVRLSARQRSFIAEANRRIQVEVVWL